MSKLKLPNDDDHPDAAEKHVLDAQALLAAGRYDGTAYLSGYVVECSLKALWLLENGVASGVSAPWKGASGHALSTLAHHASAVASAAGAKTAKYLGASTRSAPTTMSNWSPDLRYRSPTKSLQEAQAWFDCALNVYLETIAEMQLDGVL